MATEGYNNTKGYGKRPVWQWILIYVVVGAVVYGAIYYFAIAKKGGYNSTNTNYSYNSNSTLYQNTNTSNVNYTAPTGNDTGGASVTPPGY